MFDKQIKICRKKNNYTQKKFAKLLGKGLSTIQDWESGNSRPPATTIEQICNIFGVNKAWLLTDEGEMYQDNKDAKGSSINYDPDVLEVVIEVIEEVLEFLNKTLSPDRKSRLIIKLYEYTMLDETTEIDKEKVIKLVKSA